MGLNWRKSVFGVGEQQRRRTACASAQTYQHLCNSPFGKYNIETRLISLSVVDVVGPMNPYQPIPFHILSFAVFQSRILIYAGSSDEIAEEKKVFERNMNKCGSRGGGGGGGKGVQTPPGKSQVIWVSIGNQQLDPPWKKLDPPGKCWTPSGTLKNDRFLLN